MLRAQGDSLYNPLIEPIIRIWNLEEWLRSKNLITYKYIFHNITFELMLNFNDDYFMIKDVPESARTEIYSAILEVTLQESDLLRMLVAFTDNVPVFYILKDLLTFLPERPLPLLERITELFMEVIKIAYNGMLLIKRPFERYKCKRMIFVICTHAVRNRSFLDSFVCLMRTWIEDIRGDFFHHERQ